MEIGEVAQILVYEKWFKKTKENLKILSNSKEELIEYNHLIKHISSEVKMIMNNLKEPFNKKYNDFNQLFENYNCLKKLAPLDKLEKRNN